MDKKLMLVVTIIMVLGLFTGCSSRTKYKVGYEGKGYNNGAFSFTDASEEKLGAHNFVRLIASLEELKTFCDEVNNPAFRQESPKYTNDLSKKLREYDEEFFAEKSLIIYLTIAPNPGISYKIRSLIIDGEELFLNIHRKQAKPKGVWIAVIIPWTFLIEVNKADITGITSIKTK